MSEFDDLFITEQEHKENKVYHPYDKDQWIAKKKQERSDAFTLLEEATKEAVSSPEKFVDYLGVQAQFDRYSVGNALLVAKQFPNALKLADYDTWKDQGIFVKKGENGIVIMEPGSEYTREDGSTGFHLNVKKVFDISQTSAEANGVDVHTPEIRTLLKALMAESPVDMKISTSLPEGENAQYSHDDKTIYFRQGMDGDEIFRCMAQNVILAKADEKGNMEGMQFAAYCASFMLCERYGVKEDGYSFEGVSELFKDMDPKQIREDLNAIRNAANEISQGIDKTLYPRDRAEKPRESDAR